MAITIEKGIPLPANVGHQKYPFGEMEVGDSFAIPLSGEITNAGKNGDYDKAMMRVRSAACVQQKRHGGKYSVRTLKGEGVVRCWRVA